MGRDVRDLELLVNMTEYLNEGLLYLTEIRRRQKLVQREVLHQDIVFVHCDHMYIKHTMYQYCATR